MERQRLLSSALRKIREFFYHQNFTEVIVPILNDTIPLEPYIYPFTTTWNHKAGQKTFYLPTSPERYVKLMMAQGVGNCFAISSSFRNLEDKGPHHAPEFMMLEWYRKQSNYKIIMHDVEELIANLRPKAGFARPYGVLSLISLFQTFCALDLEQIIKKERVLFDFAKRKGYQTKKTTWQELYDQIFANLIEPHLPQTPVFVIDFPAKSSPLCKPQKNKLHLAERFELYINGVEIANGANENTNYISVKKRFIDEQTIRRKSGQIVPPVDLEFLGALKKLSNISLAGVAIGIDRLISVISNVEVI